MSEAAKGRAAIDCWHLTLLIERSQGAAWQDELRLSDTTASC